MRVLINIGVRCLVNTAELNVARDLPNGDIIFDCGFLCHGLTLPIRAQAINLATGIA